MAFHERTELASDGSGSRLAAYYQPISQFSACEGSSSAWTAMPSGEVMGDGDLHSQMEEVPEVECRTCHGTPTEGPTHPLITDPHDMALRQARLNPASALQLGDTVVVTDRGDTLWNVPGGRTGRLVDEQGVGHGLRRPAGCRICLRAGSRGSGRECLP